MAAAVKKNGTKLTFIEILDKYLRATFSSDDGSKNVLKKPGAAEDPPEAEDSEESPLTDLKNVFIETSHEKPLRNNVDFSNEERDEGEVTFDKNCSSAISGKSQEDKAGESVLRESTSEGAYQLPKKDLPFTDSEGRLKCTVCQWSPPDNSSESFFDHFKTSAHRTKLKQRFPNTVTEANQLGSKQEQKKPDNKNQKELRFDVSFQKKAEAQQGNSGKGRVEDITNKNLASGVNYVKASSEVKFKCHLCDKTIPPSQEFGALMNNVMMHLLGKGHLGKLEGSVETPGKNVQMMQTTKPNQRDQNDKVTDLKKRPGTAPKKQTDACAASLKNKSPNSKQSLSQNSLIQGQKNSSKEQGNNFKFLCLYCTYSDSGWDSFKAHLECSKHLNFLKEIAVEPWVIFKNLVECTNCNTLLIGSLYTVNKHYQLCLQKK